MTNTVGIILFLFAVVSFTFGIGAHWKSRRFREAIEKREESLKRKMYELAILKEVSDRVGYSLDVGKIAEVITGSLNQFLEYSTASYMVVNPESVLLKIDLERPVSKKFIKDIRLRMLNSLSALLGRDMSVVHIDQTVTGTLIDEESEASVQSFFNIPIVIDGAVLGIITIAHTIKGLYKEDEMAILYKITNNASNAITQLQQVVKREQAKLSSMIEGMIEGVVMTDMEYRVATMNASAKTALGLSSHKKVTIFDIIDSMDGQFDIRGKLEESITKDSVIVTDSILIKDKYYQVIVAPVKGIEGSIEGETLGGIVIFHDITTEKQLERIREDFTAMMVHELRSPLDAIKKTSELIRSGDLEGDKEAKAEYLKMIYTNSSQMLEIVNDLLDVAKIESGKFDISKRTSSIKQVAKDRLMFFKVVAQDAHIRLTGILGAGIPDSIEFDPLRISQVINNLLSNALKFTSPDGQVILQMILHRAGANIEAEAGSQKIKWFLNDTERDRINSLPNDVVVMAVTDSGPGISKVDVDKLFVKFQQLGLSMRNGKAGTGLGLVVSKGIIEAHDGVIGVSSKINIGSTFYCTLNI